MQLTNERLALHTTLQIGGPAEVMSFPESIDELVRDVMDCRIKTVPYRTIGRGSNVLASDQGVAGYVINLQHCCKSIDVNGQQVVAGAGVTLQKFVRTSVAHELYGNEFLMSVPGSIGGAIAMNAGTWTDLDSYISDYLISVRYLDGDCVRTLTKADCKFEYRHSVFLDHPEWIILEASFELPMQPREIGEQKIRKRMEWSLEFQDLGYANAGSVFSTGHGKCWEMLKHVQLKRAGWSRLTGNWINNYGDARFSDVMNLVRIARLVHAPLRIWPKLEIQVWK